MLECCCQDTKDAIICTDNKYGLIDFTNSYQINIIFRTFPQKRLIHVTGIILNCGVQRLPILHTCTRDAV